MDDTTKQEIADIVNAVLDVRLGEQPTPAPKHVASIVPFKDKDTEATAQRVYAYVQEHPKAGVEDVRHACVLPVHWFRNPKVLANDKRVTPGLAFMKARAGVGAVGEAVAKYAKAKAEPAQDAAKRAIAIRVAEHLEHALDDGLASGLLYEKAKSTATIRNLAATVRARVGL